jgi:hypothetical protein
LPERLGAPDALQPTPHQAAAQSKLRSLHLPSAPASWEGKMHLITAAVLICATATAPADCRAETAIDVLIAPDANSYGFCGLQSQAYIAGSALAEKVGDGRYLKILCTRKHMTATVAWPE